MQQIKKRVFIGSSTESKNVAYLIKTEIEKSVTYECTVWDKGFELSKETYGELFRNAYTTDYAIFIAAPDDTVQRKGPRNDKNDSKDKNDTKYAARDNVILESGLFAGVLGRERVYIVQHEGCELPTDLNGVTVCPYKDEGELLERCDQLKSKMEKENKQARFSFRPSTALAVGYFRNFIEPVASILHDDDRTAELKITKSEGEKKTDIRLPLSGFEGKELWVIKPPKMALNSPDEFKKWTLHFKSMNKLSGESIDENPERNTSPKWRVDISNAFRQGTEQIPSKLVIYDVPSTLGIALGAVDKLLPDSAVTTTGEQKILREMEASNFFAVLNKLMLENPVDTEDLVFIKECDRYEVVSEKQSSK